MKNKVIIAGSRSVKENDYDLWVKVTDIIKSLERNDTEIVSGTCKGGDKFGEWFAKSWELPVTKFPANWTEYGKGAGYIRKKQMAEYATHLIAIWDGKSKGTKHMIDLANSRGLAVRVIKY